MTFDTPEHKQIVLEILASVSVPGKMIEVFYELKKAAEKAQVETPEPGKENE